MTTWRLVAMGGLGLAGLMIVLLAIGSRSQTTFVVWIVLLVVGIGIFAFGRKADEDNRRRQRDEDFRLRNGG